jgi:hypothetical protein
MKKSVKKSVSVKIMAPAFLIAKVDCVAAGRSRAQAIVFLLQKGLIYLGAEEAGKGVGQ